MLKVLLVFGRQVDHAFYRFHNDPDAQKNDAQDRDCRRGGRKERRKPVLSHRDAPEQVGNGDDQVKKGERYNNGDQQMFGYDKKPNTQGNNEHPGRDF